MRRPSVPSIATIALTALLSSTPRAVAHGGGVDGERAGDLAALADRANLVFVGDVTEVTYRRARIEGGGGDLPYTVVTYAVREVLRGKAPGRTFTMRFLGGADGKGHFVEVSGVPVFQKGEQDLLFVAGNGEKGCPLVECEWGRFRILKNAMYNTHGSPVRGLVDSHAIARGLPAEELRKFAYPAPSFDGLLENPEVRELLQAQKMNPEEARKRYESEAPKQIETRAVFEVLPAKESAERDGGTDPETRPAPAAEVAKLSAEAVTIDQFHATVRSVIGSAKRAPLALASIDPNAELVVRVAPQAPVQPDPPKTERRGATAAEEAEYKALAAQDFNPVIKDIKQ